MRQWLSKGLLPRIFSRKKFLYIEIHNTHCTLSLITKNKKTLYCSYTTNIPLANACVMKEVIYNPSTIVTHIKTFLKSNPINSSSIIICFPMILKAAPIQYNLILLQLSLIAKKACMHVSHLITQLLFALPAQPSSTTTYSSPVHTLMHQENLLHRIVPQPFFTPLMTTSLTAATACLCTVIVLFYHQQTQKNATIATHVTALGQNAAHAQKIVQGYPLLKKQLATTTHHLKMFDHVAHNVHSPATFLTIIAQHIPSACYLTKVTIGSEELPAPIKKQIPLLGKESTTQAPKTSQATVLPDLAFTLEGISFNVEKISTFMRTLAQEKLIGTITLASITKVKKSTIKPTPSGATNNKINPLYSFKITGNLAEPLSTHQT